MYIYFIQAPLKYWIIKYNWNFNSIILNIIKEEHIVIEPKLKQYGVSYFQFINDLSSHPSIFSKQTDLLPKQLRMFFNNFPKQMRIDKTD